jgi:hypothetical protein
MAIGEGAVVYEHGLFPARYDDLKAADSRADHTREEGSGSLSFTSWVPEILSCSCSLATLSSIVVILWKANGKPVPHWTLSISLSAIIAILSTVSAAAMMHNVSAFISQLKWLYFQRRPRTLYHLELFDEASRGPYGSMRFLCQVKWNLATIGAFITVLRLGFSPLVQQAIQLESQTVYLPDIQATLGHTHKYMRDFAGIDTANMNTNRCKYISELSIL